MRNSKDKIHKSLTNPITPARRAIFDTKVRHAGASLIVTIPVKVVRKLSLRLGEKVTIQLNKKATRAPAKVDEN